MTTPADPTLDLVAGSVRTGSRSLVFVMRAARLHHPSPTSGGGYAYVFELNSRLGRFRVGASDLIDGTDFRAYPYTGQPTVHVDTGGDGAQVTGAFDLARNSVTVNVPLSRLAADGKALHSGDRINALSMRTFTLTGSRSAYDASFADYAETGTSMRIGDCKLT